MVDEVTQVVLRDAEATGASVLLRCTRLIGKQRRGAVQEVDVVYHHIAHVADPTLGPKHHLAKDNGSALSPVHHAMLITFGDSRVDD